MIAYGRGFRFRRGAHFLRQHLSFTKELCSIPLRIFALGISLLLRISTHGNGTEAMRNELGTEMGAEDGRARWD